MPAACLRPPRAARCQRGHQSWLHLQAPLFQGVALTSEGFFIDNLDNKKYPAILHTTLTMMMLPRFYSIIQIQ
jgi:hypothetical protein